MCLLIAKPANVKIEEDDLYNGYTSNNHGAGIAVAKDGKVIIDKGYFKFKSFYDAYLEQTNNEELPAIIHFRLATHGGQNEQNCHPFNVGRFAMAHNGVMRDFGYSNIWSDTAILSQHLNNIAAYDDRAIISKGMFALLEDVVGSYNKIAFLDADGKFYILNEKSGFWSGGAWFSNRSWKRVRSTYDYSGRYQGSRTNKSEDTEKVYQTTYSKKRETKLCKNPECNKALKNNVVDDEYCVQCYFDSDVNPEIGANNDDEQDEWEKKADELTSCEQEVCNGTCDRCIDQKRQILDEAVGFVYDVETAELLEQEESRENA